MADREEKRYELMLKHVGMLPDPSRSKILEFLEEMEANGIGLNRRIQVAGLLKRVAEILDKKFMNPEKRDIVNLMATLKKEKKKDRTRNHYVIALKQFYKWLNGTKEAPGFVEWLQLTQIKTEKKDLLNRDDVIRLIDNMQTYRDKVITQLLYDTGARIGEVLAIKRRDIVFTDQGVEISIAGREEGARKTGSRDVFVIGDSVAMLQDYLKSRSMEDDSYVFPMLYGDRNKPCNYDSYVRNLKRAMRLSGIKKNVHAHIFRSTHATELAAKGVQQAVIENQLGWTKASRTARFYIDVNSNDVKRSILRANGKDIPDDMPKENIELKTCPRCSTLNPSYAKRCVKCWLPLNLDEAVKAREKEKAVTEAITDFISPDQKTIMENLPEESRIDLLAALLLDLESKGMIEEIIKRVRK